MSEILGTFDGSKMQSSGFKKLTNGWHAVKIVDARAAEGKSWMLELDIEVLKGDDKSNKTQIRIFENAQFILGDILRACGLKVGDKKFRLTKDNVVGRSMMVLVGERVSTNAEGEEKKYNDFTRFEKIGFTPEARTGETKPAAKPKAEAEDDGIESISDDDL